MILALVVARDDRRTLKDKNVRTRMLYIFKDWAREEFQESFGTGFQKKKKNYLYFGGGIVLLP